MSRWLALAVFSIAPVTFGCGSSMRAGLANAPNLGGASVADARIHDVVSNGNDECGLYEEHGVLRNRVPPCPTFTETHPVSSLSLAPAPGEPARGLVQPWLNHFYVGWPCDPAASASTTASVRRQSHAWSALDATVAECAVPQP